MSLEPEHEHNLTREKISVEAVELARKSLYAYINENIILQSLLYDLDLLPEQLKPDSVEWSRMVNITLHFRANNENSKKKIEELEIGIKVALLELETLPPAPFPDFKGPAIARTIEILRKALEKS